MYIYQITNLVNNKIYIGQTNNIQKRWGAHKRCQDPNMLITRAIKKYGVENFKFEVLYKNIPIEKIDELEIQTIEEKGSLVPNGYNVAKGGNSTRGVRKYGAENSNAHLTEEEAQYILDNRNQPAYILYNEFCDKITYNAFLKVYKNITYSNLTTKTEMYPYNLQFSNQFTSGNKLEYDEVLSLRQRYANKEYWRDVYEDYKDIYKDEWSFWQLYNGKKFKLVCPEVFTDENKHFHSGLSKSGTLNGRAKLTEEDVKEIRKLWNEGTTRADLYEKYPQVSTTTIRDIINNKTWKHLL